MITKSLLLSGIYLFFALPTSLAAGNLGPKYGGNLSFNLGAEPTTLNPITSSDAYSRSIHSRVCDRLLRRHPDTYEWLPSLAESWDVSPDGMKFTFKIRKNAKFFDGKALTAEDVKFSYDVIFNDAYPTAHRRPYFENIKEAKVIDSHTIEFIAKEKYFNTIESLGDIMIIIPKHVYQDAKKGKKLNKKLICSGPYKIAKYQKAKRIVLERNKDWWGNGLPELKNKFNYKKITMRFVREENVEIELFKKKKLDVIFLSSEAYMKKAVGPRFEKEFIKRKIKNRSPKGFGYIGWNHLNPLFADKNVRKALSHLLNRDLINEKFSYGLRVPTPGPWYQANDYADPNVKPIPFDTQQAAKILKKAAWTDSDKNGVLDKNINGKKQEFRFTILYSSKDSEKELTIYREDLKKAGIQMELKLMEWNSFIKLVDEKKFEAVALGWTGSVEVDPKQIWHSNSSKNGGSNFVSYKNTEVDKLIDQARTELNRKKRIRLLRKVYRLIADDAPYTFLFNAQYSFYVLQKHVKQEKPTYNYTIGLDQWWLTK